METKQVSLDRGEDGLANAVLEQVLCVLPDSHIDPHFERNLLEYQLKFATKLPQTKAGNGSAQVH